MPDDAPPSFSGSCLRPPAPRTNRGETVTWHPPKELHHSGPLTLQPPSTGQPGSLQPPSHLLWLAGSAGALLPPRLVGELGLRLSPAL